MQRKVEVIILDSIDKRFVIGIDLGTTNCAVAYADLLEEKDARTASGCSKFRS